MINKIYKPVLHQKSFQELTVVELYELLRVRSEVFVVEQDCVYLDFDGDDQKSIHLWLRLLCGTSHSAGRYSHWSATCE